MTNFYPKIVIGLGSGRCGTRSLQHLLDSQPGSMFTHEALPMPWNRNPDVHEQMFGRLFGRDSGFIGDCGYYWINYVEDMLSVKPEAKFICLERDRQEVIESMWARSRGLNTHSTSDWFMMYPRYDTDRKTAIGLMWGDYKGLAEGLQTKYPESFKIFNMDSLNLGFGDNGNDVDSILNFAGFSQGRKIAVGIKLNNRPTSQGVGRFV